MYTPTEPYLITDEMFRYIHEHKHCLVTDVEYYIRQTFPNERGLNIRTSLVTLEDAGLIHLEDGFNYVSMMPKGTDVIIKDGLYSLYLERLEREKIPPVSKVSFVQKYWWLMLLFGWIGGCVTDLGKKAIEKELWPEPKPQPQPTQVRVDTVYIPYWDTSGANKKTTPVNQDTGIKKTKQ